MQTSPNRPKTDVATSALWVFSVPVYKIYNFYLKMELHLFQHDPN